MEQRSMYGEPYRSSGGGDAMSTIGTLIFGGILGAAIALLMAPKSGAELRADLKDEASRMGERISEGSSDITQSVKSKINQLGSKAEQMGEQMGENAEQMGDKAKSAASEASRKM